MYPQLTTGAYSQFPLRKQRRTRTVTNMAADGSSIKLADPNAAITEWQLRYEGLSDIELSSLQQFFSTAEGSLNGFTFLDPAGNLLAWSEDLTNAVWEAGPFLASAGGVTDPLGGTRAFHLTNSGEGAQSVTQTLNVPTGYIYSLSVYVQAAQPTTVTLLLGSNRAPGDGRSKLDQDQRHRQRRSDGGVDSVRHRTTPRSYRRVRTAGGGPSRSIAIPEEHNWRSLSGCPVRRRCVFIYNHRREPA